MKSLKEFIAEHLIYTDIFEMAAELKDYRDFIMNNIFVVIEHILLILKAEEENTDESRQYINHWKNELRKYFSRFHFIKLKVKDNIYKRHDYIMQVLSDKLELDTTDMLADLCRNKLIKEGYDLDDPDVYSDFKRLSEKFQKKYFDQMVWCLAGQGNDNKNAETEKFIKEL